MTKTFRTECATCGGFGWYVRDVPTNCAEFGKSVRCPVCTDWLAHSRLTEEERTYTIDSIGNRPDDRRGEVYVLRFLAREMLNEPFGFLTIYGRKGGGKSLLLAAMVAEFCRRRREAVYFNTGELVTMFSAGEEKEIDGFRVEGNYEANKMRLKRIPVLAVDELDKIKWSSWQVQQIGEVIEHRHRNAANLVTLFAMNKPPWEWANASEVEHFASRFRDGRFHRQWPREVKRPAYLRDQNTFDVPGMFEVQLPDIRPTLRRFLQEPTA